MPRPFTPTPMLEADEFGNLLSNGHLPRGLSYRHAWFLTLLRVRPSLTRADYQAATGVSAHTAQGDLAELAQAGLVLRIGSGPATRYCLHPDADPARDYFLTQSALQSARESLQDRLRIAAQQLQDQPQADPEASHDLTWIPAETRQDQSEIASRSPQHHTNATSVHAVLAVLNELFADHADPQEDREQLLRQISSIGHSREVNR